MSTSKDLLSSLLAKQKQMKTGDEDTGVIDLETKTTSEDLKEFAKKIETEDFSIEPEISESIKELSALSEPPKPSAAPQPTEIDLSAALKKAEKPNEEVKEESAKILGNLLKKKLVPKDKEAEKPAPKQLITDDDKIERLIQQGQLAKDMSTQKTQLNVKQPQQTKTEPRPVSKPVFPSPAAQPAPSSSVTSAIESKYGKSDVSIHELLDILIKESGSDLHLTVGNPPCIRIHGKITKTNFPPLDPPTIQHLVYSIMDNKIKDKFAQELEVDFSYQYTEEARFRVNAFQQRRGMGAVMRIIPTKIMNIEQLMLPRSIESFAYRTRGLVLVTGPTGSGKSTTLAALIDYINRSRSEHIITVEDPIEFVHEHKKCIVNQREIGINTNSFARALKSALREDPDVILVGELRDYETISLAITAAETGHLVFATLHTSSAVKTIDRIIDVFPAHQQPQIRMQLSETLIGVVAQTLVPRVDKKGRVCCTEILVSTNAVRNLIREGKTNMIYSVIQTHKEDGMRTLDDSLYEYFTKGMISFDQVYMRCEDRVRFERLIPPDKLKAFKQKYGFVDDSEKNTNNN